MSIVTTYPFDNEANYTLNNGQVSGGKGFLGFQILSGATIKFSQAFDSDTGFTYDNAKTEFPGTLMRQIDQTPASSVLGVKYTSNVDANWNKAGALTGNLNGAPSLSGGKLVCTGTQGVYYDRTAEKRESHKFIYTPNYSTSPPANINLFSCWNGSDNSDRFMLTHSPSGTGTLRITLDDFDGVSIIATATTIGPAWQPTAGQDYEIELVVNSVAGTVQVFIDGVLHGTLSPGAWTRSGAAAIRSYIGASPAIYDQAEASFDNYIMFSIATHTANYTPGYSIPDFIYAEDSIILPTFNYTGLGAIQHLLSMTITETGAPRYVFNDKYWNGSDWVSSDGTYAQASSKADSEANFSSLLIDSTTLQMRVVFPDSNSQSSVDDLDLFYEAQEFAAEGSLLTNNSFVAKDISAFITTQNAPTNTTISFIMNVNGQDMYFDGSNWVLSDGSASEANTLADVQTNIGTLLSENSTVKVKVVFTTTDPQVTSDIDLITVTYDFGALEPVAPNQCQVWGFVKDAENQPIENAAITIQPNRNSDEYVEGADRIITKPIEKTTDANGFFSANLIISDDYEVGGAQAMQYVLTILRSGQQVAISKNGVDPGGVAKTILFEVPNLASVNITDQIGAV